jgi:hypothetical protein
MSETPQETLTTYLHRGYIKGTLGPGEVREAIRAVLAQLEQARIDRDEAISQCVSIGRESKKLEAERDALRSTVHDLSVQLEESGKEERALREIMRRLVAGIDNWNASVEPIIGRPVDYKWLALEEARDVLAPEGKP